MHTFKILLQYVEWLIRYALLSPHQRRLLARHYSNRSDNPYRERVAPPSDLPRGPVQTRVYWLGEVASPGILIAARSQTSIPVLAPELMLVITGCVIFVTGCSLWFVSQGWLEALYDIPIFIISLLVWFLKK